jgi:hypothetical protein
METLDSQEKVTILPELFNHRTFPEVRQFHKIKDVLFPKCIDWLRTRLPESNHYFGCKILFNQLDYISKEFTEYFINYFKDSYFIILLRENLLRASFSVEIARKYNKWHCRNNHEIRKRIIKVDTELLFKKLERKRALREKILNKFMNCDIKKIIMTYEQLFENTKREVERICKFLDISYRGIIHSAEVKGNPYPLEEVIINYQEVENYFKQYPFYYNMLK